MSGNRPPLLLNQGEPVLLNQGGPLELNEAGTYYPPSVDETIISQYRNSGILVSLIRSIKDSLNPRANIELFYNTVWNVDTAVGYGLDVWGRIVNVKRVLTIPTGVFLGFQEARGQIAGASFNAAPFFAGVQTEINYTLNDDVYRLLILAKAAYNITDGSVPAINAILMNLFPGRGNAYVTDGPNVPGPSFFGFAEAGGTRVAPFNAAPFGDGNFRPDSMTMVYNFDFALEPFEIAIVTESGVLPKPTGVLASASYLTA